MKKLAFIFTSVMTSLVLLIGCNNMQPDNTKRSSECVIEKYSCDQINNLKTAVYSGVVTFREFKKQYKTECVRKTHQGWYCVLLQEDGSHVFVFVNRSFEITDILVVDSFMAKEEFEGLITEGMSEREVIEIVPAAAVSPFSSVEMTAHIVREGVFVIEYLRISDGQLLEDPIVNSFEFVGNEDVSDHDDFFIRDEVPFILPIDKDIII